MGAKGASTIVLDAGALIALERGSKYMRAFCREAIRGHARLVVPAAVVAQVVRTGPRQAPIHALLNAAMTEVPPLDRVLAEAVGLLCGRSGTSDVVDASVVLLARRLRAVVLTSDVGDVQALDPSLSVEKV